jgi:dipeptidase E
MKSISPQVIAIGGVPMGPGNALLDRYVLAQARRRNPSVCFIATASGDADSYVARFYATFATYRCKPTHLPLFGRTPDLERILPAQDVIYVGGGNTKSLLAVWRDWGLPQLLRKAWTSGTVLAGVSAGAICWFEAGVTDSWSGRLAGLSLLGFLPGTCCPHFDSEAERRPALHRLVATRAVPKALALDDGAAAHFVNRRLARVVSAQPTGGGYEVRRVGSRAVETELPVVRLAQSRRLTRVAPDGRRV